MVKRAVRFCLISAIIDYQSALSFGYDSDELLPLLADGQLRNGHYMSAIETLADFNNEARLGRLAIIVEVIANLVRRTTGQERQNRRPLTDKEIASVREMNNAKTCLELITTADALIPKLWMDARDLIADDDIVDAAVLVAHVMHSSRSAWAVATVRAIEHNAPVLLLNAIIDSGSHICESGYERAIEDAAAQLEEHEMRAEAETVRNAVFARLVARPDSRPVGTLRFVPLPGD